MTATTLDDLIQTVGLPAVVRLAQRWGGRALWIPEIISAGHPITVAVGTEAAARLASTYGGTEIDVPAEANALREARNLEIVRRFLDGDTVSTIATAFCLSRAMVNKVLDEHGVDRSLPRESQVDRAAMLAAAEGLRGMLERTGLSQRAVAQELGIDERSLRRYLDGERAIPGEVPGQLARLAGETRPSD